MDKLEKEFTRLLDSQNINPKDLDYSILDHHIIMLTQLVKAINSGISVFDPESVILSDRKKTVLKLAYNGKLSKEISDQLKICINTANTHRQRILKKMNANNTAEAILFASRLGLIN